MSKSNARRVYHRLVILAEEPGTVIWLVDDLGHPVQKATGALDTSLLPGHYAVEFSGGPAMYPIELTGDHRLRESELAAGPTCPRRIPELLDEDV